MLRRKNLARLLRTPLALARSALVELLSDDSVYQGDETPLENRVSHIELEARTNRGRTAGGGSVAVVPVDGVIDRRDSFFGTATEDISRVLRQLKDDDRVSGVLLDIDSPGGSVFGVQELGEEIRAFRKTKPIGAHTGGMMASAAYWLGSQAETITATPGSILGSVGVYIVHEDISQFLETAGIKPTIISAGAHKADGNPFEPLSEDAQADLQGQVDHYFDHFTKDVAKGRKVSVSKVNKDFGQGKVFNAGEALERGMVDAVGGPTDAIGSIAARAFGPGRVIEAHTVEVEVIARADDDLHEEDFNLEDDSDLDRRRRHLDLTKQKIRK